MRSEGSGTDNRVTFLLCFGQKTLQTNWFYTAIVRMLHHHRLTIGSRQNERGNTPPNLNFQFRILNVEGMPNFGTSVICGFNSIRAFGSVVKQYFCPTAASMIAASIKANVLPIHALAPPPNG